jgi:hypothetical protein
MSRHVHVGRRPEECRWTHDATEWEDIKWDTDCGEAFVFIDGGPKENKVKFCCYCGRPVKAVQP